jgi:hypothetical protein
MAGAAAEIAAVAVQHSRALLAPRTGQPTTPAIEGGTTNGTERPQRQALNGFANRFAISSFCIFSRTCASSSFFSLTRD